jgi:hypothetical protein
MLLIVFVGLIGTLASVTGDCDFGIHNLDNFNWYKVGISMCPGSTRPLKNEYLVTPGGKDGRCLRLTTYHLQVPMSRNLEALISQNTLSPIGL